MYALRLRCLSSLLALLLTSACVDPLDRQLAQKINILVVDGTITNLDEPQSILLSRAQTDSITGRAGFIPITQARVEVLVDSALVVAGQQTQPGRYQLPADFRGQVGHAYQLRFTLPDGTTYRSTQQRMQPVPPIQPVTLRFNPTSLPKGILEDFQSGFDVVLDVIDPVNQRNYYRWDWQLWEKQDWCASCQGGYYLANQLKLVSSYPNILIYQTQPESFENCFEAPSPSLFGGNYAPIPAFFINSYVCRTQCWDILPSTAISVFSDEYSNGGLITARRVGQVPYLTLNPALVEVRQSSLTADAYGYFRLVEQQTQNTGGLADGLPTALVGNVASQGNGHDRLVGYFTACAVSSVRSWLDKKEARGIAYGSVYFDPADQLTKPVAGEQQLFYAFHRDLPRREAYLNFTILGAGSVRPPTAVCLPSDSRTPLKPAGWRD